MRKVKFQKRFQKVPHVEKAQNEFSFETRIKFSRSLSRIPILKHFDATLVRRNLLMSMRYVELKPPSNLTQFYGM